MNIGEIARAAGVSRSTVSYALSGKRSISEETRRRIEAVIEDLGYRPNASARALANGRTDTLALVFPPSRNGHHYTDMQLGFLGSVVEAAAREEYDVLVSAAGGNGTDALVRLAEERRVDGVLLMESRLDDPRVAVLRERDFPFVTIGRTAKASGHDWVDLDHGALAAACVHHLADLGHEHLALVNRPQSLIDSGYTNAHRGAEGFEAAVRERGLTGRAYACDDDIASGIACTERILSDDPAVTGVVTLNEASLQGVYRALGSAGRRIPDEVSVTGIAAARWAEGVVPPLTAADVPASEMGQHAVSLLLRRITDPRASATSVLLTPALVERGSTAERAG
ncbi:LacI family DNA-binding transcriptional regulator [Streptomyces sp. NPDC090106]|uniref:LacI family DNA-binding transcriptional regulator n=1 Tax=Streptomyces sp. NPDC090106 TaxID=3365946 RepID=UPI00381C5112